MTYRRENNFFFNCLYKTLWNLLMLRPQVKSYYNCNKISKPLNKIVGMYGVSNNSKICSNYNSCAEMLHRFSSSLIIIGLIVKTIKLYWNGWSSDSNVHLKLWTALSSHHVGRSLNITAIKTEPHQYNHSGDRI